MSRASILLQNFNKTLNHVWNTHGLPAGCSYQRGVSDCTRKFTNIESYRRHARDKHTWFYNTHLKRYDKNASISDPFLLTASNDQGDEDNNTVDNSLNDAVNNGSDLTHNCDVDMRVSGNGEEVLHYKDFNQDVIVGSFLSGLRENFNTTTEAICFLSEKINKIICLEIKVSMIKESLKRNHNDVLTDYETELIMDCVTHLPSHLKSLQGKVFR